MSNPACRPTTPSSASDHDDATELHDTLLYLEERTWRALSHSGPALLPFLSADCIMQFPLGIKVTRTSQPSVRDLLHSPAFVPWSSFRLKDVDVLPAGPSGAVVSYRVKATKKGSSSGEGAGSAKERRDGEERDDRDEEDEEEEEIRFEALCVSVWRWERERDGPRRGKGKWLMCFHQQTLTT